MRLASFLSSKPGRAAAAMLLLAGLLPVVNAGATTADVALTAAEQRVSKEADRADAYVELASAFMRKSREASDPAYYARASAALDRALALDPHSYDAQRARAWVLLGQHDFRGALAAADAAHEAEPGDWWNYGTLTDAYVELGDYVHAERAAQRMLDLRPGLPAYSRAAFLRTLFGDHEGAVEMLVVAAQAASPTDPESLAWVLVHLGHEYFAAGDLERAGAVYARALDVLPEYYLGLAGLARVRAAESRLDEARDLYRRAVARIPSPDLVAALGDVEADAGDDAAAEREWALVEYIGRVGEAAGTTYGRQLALFYADHERRPAEALRFARQEATTRGGIYADDALAWALYANGRLIAAAHHAHRALRLGTADAMLHYHAGMIAAARGHRGVALRHLNRALALNRHFDLRQAVRAQATLAGLEAPVALATRAAVDARTGENSR